MASIKRVPLEFNGHAYLRQHILLSILSQRQIIVKNIRSEEENPGLLQYEISLLKLIEKVTNGCEININKTGTRLIFTPGYIDCNDGLPIEHECDR
jgi:RNA 3'-terminal phosphate cyclase-like protein